ncbi:hypothetical protein M2271_005912 [Streptomyces sp. LBL]|nr:hypothetical protein [Streptomyces sp. LBL]
MAFVHHPATGHRCAQVPSASRGSYRYHGASMGRRDVGYHFLVDECVEGRSARGNPRGKTYPESDGGNLHQRERACDRT